MRKKAYLFAELILWSCATSHVATAQTATDTVMSDGKCWIGSVSFTEGATARATDKVMACNATGGWDPYSGNSSVCIKDGKAFATGSVDGVTSNAGLTIKCLPDGTWEERPTQKEKAAP